jgi:hypothetical protein
MLGRVVLVRIDVSEELSASFITVKRIGELGTTLVVTSNKSHTAQHPRRLYSSGQLMTTENNNMSEWGVSGTEVTPSGHWSTNNITQSLY